MNYLLILLSSLLIEVNGIPIRMQEVGRGIFLMGGTSEQRSDAVSTDRPVHLVSLSDYYIGETEVTCQLWAAVMGRDSREWAAENGLQDYWISDDCPVVGVSWLECKEFIRRLDSITGISFRLPTEAEWEYAARGGTASARRKEREQTRFAGSNDAEEVGWIYRNSGNRVHAVGGKKPNALGLFDMTGNVWEWCEDSYAPYSNMAETDPVHIALADSAQERKVMRGGSWDNALENVHLSVRRAERPQYAFHDCGLRLAMSKTPEKELLQEHVRVRIGAHVCSFTLVSKNVANPFYLAEKDVTKGLWRSVMRSNPNRKKRNSEAIDGLTVAQGEAFLCQLSTKTGRHFRFPSKDEWLMIVQDARYNLQAAEEVDNTVGTFGSNYRKRKAVRRANIYLELVGAALPEPEDYTLINYQREGDKTDGYFFSDDANKYPERRHIRLVLCP